MFENFIIKSVSEENEKLKIFIDNRNKTNPLPMDVEIVRDISYIDDGKDCHKLNVYFDKNNFGKNGKLPVIINFHGGGLLYGFKEQNDLFCAMLAQMGYLVFGIDYPLITEVRIFETFRDVSIALNYVNDNLLEKYNGDFDRIYWTGDSAGGYIATYMSAIKNNPAIRIAASAGDIIIENIMLPQRALAIISGMFYSTRMDKIGLFLPKLIYGKDYKNHPFYEYTNPENIEIIKALPPCFMVTSHDDMLKKHTLDYVKVLRKNSIHCELLNFGKDKRLEHAFPALYPQYEESKVVLKRINEFFGNIENKK